MKLELKHLAAYLPYDLKVQTKHNTVKILKPHDLDRNYIFGNFVPILRPLEDLYFNLGILPEGDKPIEYLEDYADTDIEREFVQLLEDQEIEDLTLAPYSIIQKLVEWHFDIFGLIEKGLAIDINTL